MHLPPIKRGFNLSSLDNAANSSFQQMNKNDTSKIAQLQKFDIDENVDHEDGLFDEEEARDIVLIDHHGGMS